MIEKATRKSGELARESSQMSFQSFGLMQNSVLIKRLNKKLFDHLYNDFQVGLNCAARQKKLNGEHVWNTLTDQFNDVDKKG